ncbi:glycosyltransferase [Neptunomonas sp.]|uniref:glycosyltransferase n=1 Tax=Neptunomonas sp. TaxID=1971898 RepID=UPI003561955E
MKIRSLLIVQPYLTKYRIPVFSALSYDYKVGLLASVSNEFGLDIHDDSIDINVVKEKMFFKILYWQPTLFIKVLNDNLDILFITANPRYLSTWFALIIAKFKGVKVLLHGQGLYRKDKISWGNKFTYYLYSKLCDQYVAYTQLSKDSLKSLPIYKKTSVAENSIVNEYPISHKEGNENGILFIGRLRHGSNIGILIQACIEINNELKESERGIQLHIVGGGEALQSLQAQFSEFNYVHFWGEIYESKVISEISKKCFVGCYPGDAGLSVLHYMSFSLPPIVHSTMSKHMGPEPSYVKDGFNGQYFERENFFSLKKAIQLMYEKDKHQLSIIQKNAFLDYKSIVNPPLSERIDSIISKVLDQ